MAWHQLFLQLCIAEFATDFGSDNLQMLKQAIHSQLCRRSRNNVNV